MISGLSHVSGESCCSVCSCEFTEDEGGVLGYFGILPVAFCPTCYSSMCAMIVPGVVEDCIDILDGSAEPILREHFGVD